MATKLYLRQTTANGSGFSNAELSTAEPNGTNDLTADAACDLSLTAGAGQTSRTVAHADTVHYDLMHRKWISDQIDTATTTQITNNIWTFAYAGSVTNANIAASAKFSLYVLTAAGTVRGYMTDAPHATPLTLFPLAETGIVSTISGGLITGLASGDRICVEWWMHQQSSMATSYSWTCYWDGTTDPVDVTATSNAASYISTPQTIAFGGAPPPAVIPDVYTPRART